MLIQLTTNLFINVIKNTFIAQKCQKLVLKIGLINIGGAQCLWSLITRCPLKLNRLIFKCPFSPLFYPCKRPSGMPLHHPSHSFKPAGFSHQIYVGIQRLQDRGCTIWRWWKILLAVFFLCCVWNLESESLKVRHL